jgi:hypothetical protein
MVLPFLPKNRWAALFLNISNILTEKIAGSSRPLPTYYHSSVECCLHVHQLIPANTSKHSFDLQQLIRVVLSVTKLF